MVTQVALSYLQPHRLAGSQSLHVVYSVAVARTPKEDAGSKGRELSVELALLPGPADFGKADPLRASFDHLPVRVVADQQQQMPRQLTPVTVAIAVVGTSWVASSRRQALHLAEGKARLAGSCSEVSAALIPEDAADRIPVSDAGSAVGPAPPEGKTALDRVAADQAVADRTSQAGPLVCPLAAVVGQEDTDSPADQGTAVDLAAAGHQADPGAGLDPVPAWNL